MQFNDTATKDGLIQACESYLNLGDAGISGNSTLLAEFTRRINVSQNVIVSQILASQDEWDFDDPNYTDYPIATTSLVADQQSYIMPTSLDLLQIKRVEITYDGTNWYRAEAFDINESGRATNTADISQNFVTTQPYYDTQYNALFLYPIPSQNVTAGLKIWFSRNVDQFTASDTSQEPAIDKPFHDMIAVKASLDYALSKGLKNKNDLKVMFDEFTTRLQRYYSQKNKGRVYQVKSSYVDYS